MNIFNLFPTAVGSFNIGRQLTQKELDFCKNQETRANQGNTVSTNYSVLKAEELADLKQFLQSCLNSYFQEIVVPDTECEVVFTQSWLNYTKKDQHHHKHAHPNSFLSGVFYVNADKDKDRIYFFQDQWKQLSLPAKSYNPYNSESWWLPVGTGDVLIFPSSLTHKVEPVIAEETRISIAFNTFIKGTLGIEHELTGLVI
jgi:uncharacterized protein (TIGR02466 family)